MADVPVRVSGRVGPDVFSVDAGTFTYLPSPAPPPWEHGPASDTLSDLELWKGSYNGWDWGWSTPWQIESVDGFADMMALKTQDADNPGDGEIFGQDWERKRVLTVEFSGALTMVERCWPERPDLLPPQRLMDARCACLRRQDDLPLWLNDRWVIMARPRRFVAPQRRGAVPSVTVSWEAQDPALYEATEQSASAALQLGGGGRGWIRTFVVDSPNVPPAGNPGRTPGSWRYASGGTSGLMMVTNRGCRRTFLRFRIRGPVQWPILFNERTGEKLELNLTLGAQDVLDVDMRSGTVVLNGQASRYYALTEDSSWWAVGPGTTPIRYLNRGPLTGSPITVWWRSAW